jgi:predicted Zn-ribbon and HTH transcriptional regulator
MRKTIDIFEKSIEESQRYKDEEDARQRKYEQNRINIKERMRKLKQFIYEKRGCLEANQEFFEENKKYFQQYDVKNMTELQKLIKQYDRENPEEAEKFEKDRYRKFLKIDHIKTNELIILPEIRRFDNSQINLNSGINKIYIMNVKNYFKKLQNCKVNEYTYIPDKTKYIKNKINNYKINNLDNYFIQGIKKIKYNNEIELIEASNICNITLEKTLNNFICSVENYIVNGIPVDELRNRKIKKILKNLSEKDKKNYEKVKEIIEGYKNKEDKSYILNDNYCVNCNQIFNDDKEKKHNGHCTLQINIEIDNDLNNIDYNVYLNKIYDCLKGDQNKILNNGNRNLIVYYGKLLNFVYTIIINNNSIEELNSSIININDDYTNEKESDSFNDYFKDYFSFYVRKISKLAYFKVKKIEQILADLEEYNNNVSTEIDLLDDEEEEPYNINKNERIDEILSTSQKGNFDNNSFKCEEDKKKFFLKLGLKMKFDYGKNDSITYLYSKAKELNLEPSNYESFLMEQLGISKAKK